MSWIGNVQLCSRFTLLLRANTVPSFPPHDAACSHVTATASSAEGGARGAGRRRRPSTPRRPPWRLACRLCCSLCCVTDCMMRGHDAAAGEQPATSEHMADSDEDEDDDRRKRLPAGAPSPRPRSVSAPAAFTEP